MSVGEEIANPPKRQFKYRPWLAVVGAVLLVGLGYSLWVASKPKSLLVPHRFVVDPDDRSHLLESPSVHESIDLATEYLIGNCDERGRFIYVRDLNRPYFESGEYNMLRHAGAIYSLCQRQSWRPHPNVESVVKRAVQFLHRESLMTLPGRDNLLAVWSVPELIGSAGPLTAKLGGTGLGLVAMMEAEVILPGLTEESDLRAMGDFLIFMQKSDGGFYSRFIPGHGGRNDDWESLYYPGEAALGLIKLYQHTEQPSYLSAARSALLYLADVRHGQDHAPADHWALLATAELMRVAPEELTLDQRDRLLQHAEQVCRSMLVDVDRAHASSPLLGAFTDDGRTTPTATRVEGLLAALTFLPTDAAGLRHHARSACDRAVEFLLASQLREGPFAGAMPRSIGRLRPLWSRTTRNFNQRAAEVRVDYVQHALSAWVQYELLRGGRE